MSGQEKRMPGFCRPYLCSLMSVLSQRLLPRDQATFSELAQQGAIWISARMENKSLLPDSPLTLTESGTVKEGKAMNKSKDQVTEKLNVLTSETPQTLLSTPS